MITPPKSFEKLSKSAFGKDLAKYLAEHIIALDSLKGIDFTDEKKAAIQGEGRKVAAETLKEILSTLLLVQEGGKIKDERDDFSLTIND